MPPSASQKKYYLTYREKNLDKLAAKRKRDYENQRQSPEFKERERIRKQKLYITQKEFRAFLNILLEE